LKHEQHLLQQESTEGVALRDIAFERLRIAIFSQPQNR